jgi:WD40 repeat protein
LSNGDIKKVNLQTQKVMDVKIPRGTPNRNGELPKVAVARFHPTIGDIVAFGLTDGKIVFLD